jgi:hypothetical protein
MTPAEAAALVESLDPVMTALHETALAEDDWRGLLAKLDPMADDVHTALSIARAEAERGVAWGQPLAGPALLDFDLVPE